MKLSIITINKDNAEGLRRTMESVLGQTCKNFEYIVVDGASTDGSVEVMQELAAAIQESGAYVDAQSEPDSGLYNAMNKGARKAKGEYVLMLNSGDWFVDEKVVERVLPLLDGTDIIQGNVIRLRDGKEVLDRGYGRSDINFIDVQQGHFLHQASFCRRELFERYGYFDESYRIIGDYVFYVKTLGYGNASFVYDDIDVAVFAEAGVSSYSNSRMRDIHLSEDRRVNEELFSKRLYELCMTAPRKMAFYENLRRYSIIWKVAMVLERLSNWVKKIKCNG